MALNDVKEITIPEGSVKKIEDSNGNIIWGSQSAFPYELLEYVDIPASAYINLNTYSNNNNTGLRIDAILNLDGGTVANATYPIGAIYRRNSSSSYARYHLSVTPSLVQAAYASGSYTNVANKSELSSRHTYEFNIHTYKDGRMYYDGVDKGVFSPSSTNVGSLYIGGRRRNIDGNLSIDNFNYSARVWSVVTREDTYESIFYPVKRKSDGVVGLLKVYNNGQSIRFCASETATACVAGPVVNEYWDIS